MDLRLPPGEASNLENQEKFAGNGVKTGAFSLAEHRKIAMVNGDNIALRKESNGSLTIMRFLDINLIPIRAVEEDRMTWNRAHKPAEIIPFPADKAKERRPLGLDAAERGKVLLYTGVRYERRDEADPVWRGDSHRPRRGGRGS